MPCIYTAAHTFVTSFSCSFFAAFCRNASRRLTARRATLRTKSSTMHALHSWDRFCAYFFSCSPTCEVTRRLLFCAALTRPVALAFFGNRSQESAAWGRQPHLYVYISYVNGSVNCTLHSLCQQHPVQLHFGSQGSRILCSEKTCPSLVRLWCDSSGCYPSVCNII